MLSTNINLDISKHKNAVINLGIILIFVFIAINVYKNQSKKYASLNQNKEIEANKNKILDEISQLERNMEAIHNVINSKNMSVAINTLSDMASEAGVKILSLRPLPEEGFPLYVKYTYDLTLEANSYHAMGKFISKIESSPFIFKVEYISMQPQANIQKGQLELITANLKISTVLLKAK